MSNDSLRAIVAQTKDIVSVIVEMDGATTPEIDNFLATLEVKTPAKIDSYVHVMEQLDVQGEYWKKKALEFQRAAKACETVTDRLRENLKYAMEELKTNELTGNDYRFRRAPAKAKLILNEEYLDGSFFREEVVREPDKEKIRAALEAGQDVDGAMLQPTFSLRKFVNSKGEGK